VGKSREKMVLPSYRTLSQCKGLKHGFYGDEKDAWQDLELLPQEV